MTSHNELHGDEDENDVLPYKPPFIATVRDIHFAYCEGYVDCSECGRTFHTESEQAGKDGMRCIYCEELI